MTQLMGEIISLNRTQGGVITQVFIPYFTPTNPTKNDESAAAKLLEDLRTLRLDAAFLVQNHDKDGQQTG